MTPVERTAKAQRAAAAYDEFIGPMLTELRNEYAARMMAVATEELSRDKRTDKLTALSCALKIVNTLEAGLKETMRDGELAMAERLRDEKIERMTAPQRRLLGIAPY